LPTDPDPDDDPDNEPPTEQPPIDDGTGIDSPPPSEGSTKAWALLNLIMVILGIVLGIVTGIRVLLISQQEDEEMRDSGIYENENFSREEYRHESRIREEFAKIRFIWLSVTLIMAIIAVIVYILTEDMRLPMVLIDRWTLIHAIILTIEIVAVILAFRRGEYNDYNYENDSLNHPRLN